MNTELCFGEHQFYLYVAQQMEKYEDFFQMVFLFQEIHLFAFL